MRWVGAGHTVHMTAPTPAEIRRQICYELKWMLWAVDRFETVIRDPPPAEGKIRPASDAIAFQDSALLHARNLIEFAAAEAEPAESTESSDRWALSDILGTHSRKVPGNLRRFLNNWVVHLGVARSSESKWPKDLEGNAIAADDDARLSRLVEVVFKLLKPKHRTVTLQTEAGTAYIALLEQARAYFEQRTPEAFDRVTCDT